MTGRAAEPSYEVGPWAALSRRLSPYLDLIIGVVAAGLAVASLLTTDPASIDSRLRPPDALAVLATLAAGLCLMWRRTRPVTAFTAFVACCLLVTLTNHYIGLLSVILLLSLYSLAAHGRRRRAGVAGLVATLVTFAGLALAGVPDLRTADVAEASALLVTAWAVGDAIRSRRTQQRERLRAAEQEARAARAGRPGRHGGAAADRPRAARRGGAQHVPDRRPGRRRRARHPQRRRRGGARPRRDRRDQSQGADPDALAARAAAGGGHRVRRCTGPAIGDLETLVAGVREAGIAVSLTVSGPARPLDAGVELTAYRVVQESLTNVLKHSGSPSATVQVSYAADTVDVEVVDAGRGSRTEAAPTSGHGLVGLRERARLLGGTLDYGAAPGRGFRVAARLPAPPLPEAS